MNETDKYEVKIDITPGLKWVRIYDDAEFLGKCVKAIKNWIGGNNASLLISKEKIILITETSEKWFPELKERVTILKKILDHFAETIEKEILLQKASLKREEVAELTRTFSEEWKYSPDEETITIPRYHLVQIHNGLKNLKLHSSARWVVDELNAILNFFPKVITWLPLSKQLERP
jgi:hypothetical protein